MCRRGREARRWEADLALSTRARGLFTSALWPLEGSRAGRQRPRAARVRGGLGGGRRSGAHGALGGGAAPRRGGGGRTAAARPGSRAVSLPEAGFKALWLVKAPRGERLSAQDGPPGPPAAPPPVPPRPRRLCARGGARPRCTRARAPHTLASSGPEEYFAFP